jgi:hypothetical protein
MADRGTGQARSDGARQEIGMDKAIERVWVAAADLELRQLEVDAAKVALWAAVRKALEEGAAVAAVSDASGLPEAELLEFQKGLDTQQPA